MDDLISRQAARRIIEDINTFVSGWRYSALEQIDELPTAEPKRGRWEWNEYGNWHCTACKQIAIVNGNENYCPNCGARMEEI